MAKQPASDALPLVTAGTILRAVYLRKWVGVVSGLWFIWGLLDVFDSKLAPRLTDNYKAAWGKFYALSVFDWKTWLIIGLVIVIVATLHGAYTFAREYSTRYEKLTEYKLIFEIDLRNTVVRVEQAKSAIRIFANIQLWFENMDIHPLSVKGIDISLHRYGIKGVREAADIFTLFAILRVSSNGAPINKSDIEGMMVQARRVTPFYLIEAMLAIKDEQIKTAEDLDVVTYIKVTLRSSGYQPEFPAKLFPYWKAALEEGGTSQIMVTGAPSIPEDLRRIS